MTGAYGEHGVQVWSDRRLAVVTPLVQIGAGNAQQFWEALAFVSRDHAVIVVDLAALPDCDGHVISALIMALRCTDVGGGELRVAAGSPAVLKVLASSGADRLFAVFDSLADALADGDPPFEPGLSAPA